MALYLGTSKVSSGLYTKGRGVLDEYSEAEIKTNKVWKNGKPIYRKVWNNLTLPSLTGSWVSLVSYPSSEVEDVTDLRAILVGGDGRKITIPYYESSMYYLGISYQPPANEIELVGQMSGFVSNRMICIMEYTKPQDEVASGYIPDNLPRQLDNYSTEEQIVGKWIDGKPIYRKVFSGSTGTGTNLSSVLLNNGSIEKIINCYGNVKGASDEQLSVLSDKQALLLSANHTTLTYFFNNSDSYSYSYEIVVEYTKTTD